MHAVHRRILVVEDDEMLRAELASGLRAHGFEVLGAGDGDDGARRATEEAVGHVLLDIEMPALDGLRLAQVVRALVPGANLVMMSGHPYLRRAAADLLGPDVEILAKPFALDDLLSRLVPRASA
ncbi:MAG: response regulator [Zavarzinia sp.]|nr:response regulator [Zavarzinia sp.]